MSTLAYICAIVALLSPSILAAVTRDEHDVISLLQVNKGDMKVRSTKAVGEDLDDESSEKNKVNRIDVHIDSHMVKEAESSEPRPQRDLLHHGRNRDTEKESSGKKEQKEVLNIHVYVSPQQSADASSHKSKHEDVALTSRNSEEEDVAFSSRHSEEEDSFHLKDVALPLPKEWRNSEEERLAEKWEKRVERRAFAAHAEKRAERREERAEKRAEKQKEAVADFEHAPRKPRMEPTSLDNDADLDSEGVVQKTQNTAASSSKSKSKGFGYLEFPKSPPQQPSWGTYVPPMKDEDMARIGNTGMGLEEGQWLAMKFGKSLARASMGPRRAVTWFGGGTPPFQGSAGQMPWSTSQYSPYAPLAAGFGGPWYGGQHAWSLWSGYGTAGHPMLLPPAAVSR